MKAKSYYAFCSIVVGDFYKYPKYVKRFPLQCLLIGAERNRELPRLWSQRPGLNSVYSQTKFEAYNRVKTKAKKRHFETLTTQQNGSKSFKNLLGF